MAPLRRAALLLESFWRGHEASHGGLSEPVDRTHDRARGLTRCYYIALLSIAFHHLSLWDYYLALRHIQPLWPVSWAALIPGPGAAGIVLMLFLLGSFLAALFPDRRAARVLAFVGCLEFFAFRYSFGCVRHVHHLLILSTFAFTLLPGGHGGTHEAKRSYLRAFWGVQCCVLLTYSMSGLAKIVIGLWHLATEGAGVLTPAALSLHVANAGIRLGIDPPLADLAMRAGIAGLPLYLAVIYVETLSLAIAFRPRLHRAWGAALIAMHLGIGLTLNLFFSPSILVNGILLLASPFAPASPQWKRAVRDLPLFGRLLAPFRSVVTSPGIVPGPNGPS